jgi:hypothetical protein
MNGLKMTSATTILSTPVATSARVTALAVMCFVSAVGITQTARDGMVDLGGHRIHFLEAGPGARTVVFESGLGEDLDDVERCAT